MIAFLSYNWKKWSLFETELGQLIKMMSKLASTILESLSVQLDYMSTRSKQGKTSQLPLFVLKLLDILNNEELADVVAWTSSGDSFLIRNVSRFTEEVLPAYYKHHNIASFIRQLNIYSFKKVRHADGENVYAHPHFIRGKPHLIKHILRKSREEKEGSVPVVVPLDRNDKNGRDISELRLKQQNLYDMCRQFLFHNKKLLEENDALVHKLERDCKDKEKRLEQFLVYLVTQKNYRALNDSNSLPIHQAEHDEGDAQATPLQAIADNMSQHQNYRKMKSLLESAFNGRSSRRRDNNFTIVQIQEQPPAQERQPIVHLDRTEQMGLSPVLEPNQGNSLLSLDAFDFADDGLELDSLR